MITNLLPATTVLVPVVVSFVTVTFPSLSTVKVMSVTTLYPAGALISWKTYSPASSFSDLAVLVEVQLSTSLPSFEIRILAPSSSSPPRLTLLISISLLFVFSSLNVLVKV